MNPSYHRRAIFCYDPNEQPGSRIAPSNSTLGAGYADGTWVHSQIAVTGGMVLPNSSAEFTGWFVDHFEHGHAVVGGDYSNESFDIPVPSLRSLAAIHPAADDSSDSASGALRQLRPSERHGSGRTRPPVQSPAPWGAD